MERPSCVCPSEEDAAAADGALWACSASAQAAETARSYTEPRRRTALPDSKFAQVRARAAAAWRWPTNILCGVFSQEVCSHRCGLCGRVCTVCQHFLSLLRTCILAPLFDFFVIRKICIINLGAVNANKLGGCQCRFMPIGLFPRLLGKAVAWASATSTREPVMRKTEADLTFGRYRLILRVSEPWRIERKMSISSMFACERTLWQSQTQRGKVIKVVLKITQAALLRAHYSKPISLFRFKLVESNLIKMIAA